MNRIPHLLKPFLQKFRLVVLTAVIATALTVVVPGAIRAQTAVAPSNSALPTISGSNVKGQTLTASSGSWSGTTPFTFSYGWLRCDSSGGSCTTTSDTDATYTLGSADVGKRIRAQVTATNSDGGSSALSDATDVVTDASGPVNTNEPTISGNPAQGSTLTAGAGTWTGTAPITYTYQWVRCGSDGGAADGSNCSNVSGTATTYTLQSSDVGGRMRVRVTATNSAGSKTVASNATSTVKNGPGSGKPVNTNEPTINGTPSVGQTLSVSGGTWTGASPITLKYQWVRCGSDGGASDGGNCPTISGATGTSYKLGSSDAGKRLRVRVTASNSAGSTLVASNPTATVGTPGPSGTITLPNGDKSIPVSGIPADQRLIVDSVAFSPSRVSSRHDPITVRIRVKDTRGYVVRDARIFIRSTPLVTTGGNSGAQTATDGWVSITMTPRANFPEIRNGYAIQFFVKAYRAGDPTLAGVAGTRLVQVTMAR